VLNPAQVEPATDAEADLAAAWRVDGYHNRWFLEPLYGRGYPTDMLDHFAQYFAPPAAADLREIAAPTDFLGINYYFPNVVSADPSDTFLGARSVRRPSRSRRACAAGSSRGWRRAHAASPPD